ncbi:MAG: hypothetical protein AB1631_28015, partial [Acidobacteriota bacterium]
MKSALLASSLISLLLIASFPARAIKNADRLTGHRAPVMGADFIFANWPHPLIEGLQDSKKSKAMTRAFAAAGLTSLRFSFHGFYSPRGERATAAIKAENKRTNEFPWFPIDDYIDYIAGHDFTTVLGVNVEEGADVAYDVASDFLRRASRRKLVAVELSNEPHLNRRPWQPEEYAERAADIIEFLSPLRVKFALPLTVGNESKTPTRLSDNEWNKRMLTALSKRISLKTRSDIYGVLHLYARGVSSDAIDAFNKAVRPFAPRMRYLVTEFNIRSSLKDNPHLTDEYALEFARKVAEIMSRPEIEAIYVHGVPYHAIMYWSDGRRVVTVNGHNDPRLTREDRTEGWHLTPAGRVYNLYSGLAWNGEVLFFQGGGQSYWAVRDDRGRIVLTLLNTEGGTARKNVKIEGRQYRLTAPARSIVCF